MRSARWRWCWSIGRSTRRSQSTNESLSVALAVLVAVCRAGGDLDTAWQAATSRLDIGHRLGGHHVFYYAIRDAVDVTLDRRDLDTATRLLTELDTHATALDTDTANFTQADAVTRLRRQLGEIDTTSWPLPTNCLSPSPGTRSTRTGIRRRWPRRAGRCKPPSGWTTPPCWVALVIEATALRMSGDHVAALARYTRVLGLAEGPTTRGCLDHQPATRAVARAYGSLTDGRSGAIYRRARVTRT